MKISQTEVAHQDSAWPFIYRLIRDYAADRPSDLELSSMPELTVLEAFCERHRIAPLVAAQMLKSPDSLPTSVKDWLSRSYLANVCQVLDQTAATRRLMGHPHCPHFKLLKGLGTASIAYHHPADRHAGDVDLLLDNRHQVEAVEAIISAQGYAPYDTHYAFGRQIQKLYFYLTKHNTWIEPDGKWRLEIHWASPDRGIFPAFMQERNHYRSIPTLVHHDVLKTPQLFVYLCSHGSRSGWERLKWLLDLYLLLPHLTAEDWREICVLCEREHLQYHLQIALCILTLYFPDSRARTPAHLPTISAESWLVQYCLSRINPKELTAPDTIKDALYRSYLGNGKQRRHAVAQTFMRTKDYSRYQGPLLLAILSAPLVRPISLVWRKTLRPAFIKRRKHALPR